ncbi:protein kinase domain-containing protein [Kitasatospora sp. KL5]|uniref:protein kinase domain-containing protein n=1 Tax=Kitasatospora sp. KL5 TaxID=3425125 RepID=UPI003D700B72
MVEGLLLDERYELLERLGNGGPGERWRAHDRQLGASVVVTVLAEAGTDPADAERLTAAARAAKERAEHPNLAAVLDGGRDGATGTVFAVSEQVEGRTLDEVLAAEGAPNPGRAADWARQICAALAASHAVGAVHRDLRPGHLVLTADGTVKLLGLGIATADPGQATGGAGALSGVPWMSPEQVRGAEEVDHRSDLYAVGCLMYQLFTGKTPFGHREPTVQFGAHLREAPAPPSRHRPGLPAGLDELVLQLLAKGPEDRPEDAGEVLARLDSLAPQLAAAGTDAALFGLTAPALNAPAAPPVSGFPAAFPAAAAAAAPVPPAAPVAQPAFDSWEEDERGSWWRGSPGRRAGLVAGSAALALALVSGVTWAVSSQGGTEGGGAKAAASAGASGATGTTGEDTGATGEVPAADGTAVDGTSAAPSGASTSAGATGASSPGAPADGTAPGTTGAPGTSGPSGTRPGTTPAPGTTPGTGSTPTTAAPVKAPPSPATSAATYGCSGGLVGSYPVTTPAGVVFGYFYIWFDASSGKNCAATIKTVNSGYGTASSVKASISRCTQTAPAANCSKVAGTTATDQGDFAKFAGPVRVAAVKICINGYGSITWAGQTATTSSLGNRAVHCS